MQSSSIIYQVTDGNYTVAWLVADENDGAGYYEDDEDDQVLVNLCLLCTFYLFNLDKLIMDLALKLCFSDHIWSL